MTLDAKKTPRQLWHEAGGDRARYELLMIDEGHIVKVKAAEYATAVRERDRLRGQIDRVRGILRRVPIVRAAHDGSGYTCIGCGARSGIDLKTGAEFDERCSPGCWVGQLHVEGLLGTEQG